MGTIKGLKRTVSTNLALPIAAIATGPILARGLGVEDRGLLAAYTSALMIGMYVAAFGAQEAQSAFTARGAESGKKLAARRTKITILATCTAGLAGVIFVFYGDTFLGIVCCAIPMLVYNQALRGHLQGLQHFSVLLAERWFGVLARLAALAALMLVGALTVESALLVQAISMGVPLLLVLGYTRMRGSARATSAEKKPQGEKRLYSGYWRFSGQVWLGGLLTAVMLRADQLLMAGFSTLSELGLYAVAVSLADVLVLVSSAVKIALVPAAVDLKLEEFGGIFRKAMCLGLAAMPVALPAAYFGIPIVFGSDFSGARLPALILLTSFLAILILDLFDALLQSRGIGTGRLWATVGAALVTLALLPWFAGTWGARGAAIVSLIAYCVAALSIVFVAKRKLKLPLLQMVKLLIGVSFSFDRSRRRSMSFTDRRIDLKTPERRVSMEPVPSGFEDDRDKLVTIVARLTVVLLTLIPVSAALALARTSAFVDFGPLNQVALAGFFGLVVLLLLLIVTGQRANKVRRDRRTLGAIILLLCWLSISYAASEREGGATNYLLIAFVSLVISVAFSSHLDLFKYARLGFRIAALTSVVLYVIAPVWYINAPPNFIDSGKIVAGLPNVQGILGHPNYTGLFFAIAIVLEAASVTRRNRPKCILSISFLLLDGAILASTQARNAILAACLATLVVYAVRTGRRVSARFVAIGTMSIATTPFLISLYAVLTVTRPDYSILTLLGTRSSLWVAVCKALDADLWIGAGGDFIVRARSQVMDVDVLNVTHAHNQLLNILGEGGIVGIVLAGALICGFFRRWIYASKENGAIAGLVVVFSMSTLSETPITPYLTQAGTVLIILVVAAVSSRSLSATTADLRNTRSSEPDGPVATHSGGKAEVDA